MTALFISMRNKPLHKWQYKGRQPKEERDAGRDWFECVRCGFVLVSYVHEPPARGIQRLIGHNSQLKTCEPNKEA